MYGIITVHGSSLSLVSTASSLYSTAEEKQAHEIRKLRRELMEAQDKVHTLTNQLSTNVSVTFFLPYFPSVCYILFKVQNYDLFVALNILYVDLLILKNDSNTQKFIELRSM
jgi:hypothetical protein